MKEVIKGQDKLKLAVEKLESELFKGWPSNPGPGSVGVIIDSSITMKFNGCKITNTPSGVHYVGRVNCIIYGPQLRGLYF